MAPVPVKATSRREAAAFTKARLVAFVGQAFDVLDELRKRGKGTDEDLATVMARQILEDPISAYERLGIRLDKDAGDDAAPGQGGITLNIKDLYLNAAQHVNGSAPQLPPIEGEIVEGTIGVADDTSDW